jgi:hypothetical protein
MPPRNDSQNLKLLYKKTEQTSRIITQMIINNIGAGQIQNVSAKKKANKAGDKTKFSIFGSEEESGNQPQNIGSIPDINPYISLQEHNTTAEAEREDLNKASKEILNALNKIRIKLLSDDLKFEDLEYLKRIVNSQNGVFKTPEIQELYNQVRIKAETELAKYYDKMRVGTAHA